MSQRLKSLSRKGRCLLVALLAAGILLASACVYIAWQLFPRPSSGGQAIPADVETYNQAEVAVRMEGEQSLVSIQLSAGREQTQTVTAAPLATGEPLSPEEQQQILDLYSPYARRLAFYRGVI